VTIGRRHRTRSQARSSCTHPRAWSTNGCAVGPYPGWTERVAMWAIVRKGGSRGWTTRRRRGHEQLDTFVVIFVVRGIRGVRHRAHRAESFPRRVRRRSGRRSEYSHPITLGGRRSRPPRRRRRRPMQRGVMRALFAVARAAIGPLAPARQHVPLPSPRHRGGCRPPPPSSSSRVRPSRRCEYRPANPSTPPPPIRYSARRDSRSPSMSMRDVDDGRRRPSRSARRRRTCVSRRGGRCRERGAWRGGCPAWTRPRASRRRACSWRGGSPREVTVSFHHPVLVFEGPPFIFIQPSSFHPSEFRRFASPSFLA
jgi:hypothetical protein